MGVSAFEDAVQPTRCEVARVVRCGRVVRIIRAGAALVQFYSALVFKGPGLIGEIKQGLASEVRNAGLPRLSALVGRDAAAAAGSD